MSDNNTVDLNEVSSAGKPILKGQFSLRCIKAEKGTSRKGNSMITFTWEFVAPATALDPAGKQVKIPGLQVMDWAVLGDNGLPKFKALHKVCKLPMTLNLQTPDTRVYLGKAVKASIVTETDVAKDDNTGEILVDDEGHPVTRNSYKIIRFNASDDQYTVPMENAAF